MPGIALARARGEKCPRCWRYTGEGRFNYDKLCDRCCRVLIEQYPEHESVPHIREAYSRQKQELDRKRTEREEKGQDSETSQS